MSIEKQIDTLRNDLMKSEFWTFDEETARFELDRHKTAKNLHRKGYRLASDVAREILDTIKSSGIDRYRYPVIAEIEKKYTEGEG